MDEFDYIVVGSGSAGGTVAAQGYPRTRTQRFACSRLVGATGIRSSTFLLAS